jgi:hypothetical protein
MLKQTVGTRSSTERLTRKSALSSIEGGASSAILGSPWMSTMLFFDSKKGVARCV